MGNGILPAKTHNWTAKDFMSNYDSSQDSDTYVNITKVPNPCSITIKYVDKDDPTKIISPQTTNMVIMAISKQIQLMLENS